MIDFNSGTWSPGSYAFWIFAAIAAVMLLAGLFGMIATRDKFEWGTVFTVGLMIAVFAGFAQYPFSEDFHKYYTVTGTVEDTNMRLVTTENEAYLVAVVTVDGNMFRIDDARGTTVEKGDSVNLRCKREFEWNSVPGWGCKWNAKAGK